MPGHLCRTNEHSLSAWGCYVGPALALQGLTAVLVVDGSETVQAQFDNVKTGLGYGWFDFPEEYFEIRSY